MKKKLTAAIIAGLMSISTFCAASPDKDTLAQVALLQSLAQGYLGGEFTVGELRAYGDTGIGTFKGVNGEMIVLDGTVYQAMGDGTVVVASDDTIVPFSNVTFFEKDYSVKLENVSDKNTFESILTQAVKEHGENSFYMVKLHTKFPYILFRSEYESHEPYPTLVEALKGKQTEFTEHDIEGTLVGLYCPSYMGGLNSTGWHFHFISDDRMKGGHILELSVNEGEAELNKNDKFTMILHDDQKFHEMNLAKDMNEDIHKAEHDSRANMEE